MKVPLFWMVVLAGVPFSGMAQPRSSALAFDAASIKRSPPADLSNGYFVGCKGGPGSSDPGLFTCTNYNVANLITLAFQLKAYQYPSADYSDTTMYDIQAKVPSGTTISEMYLMLQNLLVERFHLVHHWAPKEMQVYDLSVARGGLKMKELPLTEGPAADQSKKSGSPPNGTAALDAEGFPVVSPPKRGVPAMMVSNGHARWVCFEAGIDTLVLMLTNYLQGPVTDSTGLKGKYDITLSWLMDNGPGSDSHGPTLVQAILDQLGLKLERKKGLVDVFVTDHINKVPSPN